MENIRLLRRNDGAAIDMGIDEGAGNEGGFVRGVGKKISKRLEKSITAETRRRRDVCLVLK